MIYLQLEENLLDFLVINSNNFCSFEDAVILPSFLKNINCLYDSMLIVGFFPFVILKMTFHDLLAAIASDEKLAVTCIAVLLYITYVFPLAAFRTFLSIFNFQQFVMWLDVNSFSFLFFSFVCI